MVKIASVLPYKALDAVSSAGAEDVTDLQGTYNQVAAYVDVSGGPSFSILLLGSLDNVNFYQLGSTITAQGLYVATGAYLVRFVKVHLSTLSGGSSPSITTWIAVNG